MTRMLFLAALLTGCADKIEHAQPDAQDTPTLDAAVQPPAGKVVTARGSDATYTTAVDATSETAWVYADLETGKEVEATAAWDLRFQRFHISANGGTSGSGGVEIALVAGKTFAEVTAAPADGYLTDDADSYVFEQGDGWYDYNPTTHILTPFPNVYVVKTDGGARLKLEIVKYYNDAGTAAHFTLHWAPLP